MDKVKIGWLFDVISSGSTPPTGQSKYYENGTINWLNSGDLTDGLVTKIPKKVTNEALLKFPTLKIYEPNSIVMAMYGATIAKLGIVMDYFTTNQACVVLSQPKESVYQKFIFYVLMAKRKDIINESRGGGQPNISQNIVKNIRLSLPDKHKQVLIVQYIDSKTSEIDNLISSKEKQIQLLEEQCQAMITEAVTKGLNPDVNMKSSRIEWIGEIPNHWFTTKLKYVTNKIIDGTHSTPKYIDEGIPFLRVTDITQSKNNNIIMENIKYISSEEHNELIKRCDPRYGDLLVSKNGTIGIPKVVDWKWDFSIFVSLCLIRPNQKVTSKFLYYFFKSFIVTEQISYGQKKSTINNLHLEKIKEFYFFLPSKEEQNEICDFLNEETEKTDLLHKKLATQIEKIKEYRQSLIHEAVTGKIPIDEMEKYLKEVEDDGN